MPRRDRGDQDRDAPAPELSITRELGATLAWRRFLLPDLVPAQAFGSPSSGRAMIKIRKGRQRRRMPRGRDRPPEPGRATRRRRQRDRALQARRDRRVPGRERGLPQRGRWTAHWQPHPLGPQPREPRPGQQPDCRDPCMEPKSSASTLCPDGAGPTVSCARTAATTEAAS